MKHEALPLHHYHSRSASVVLRALCAVVFAGALLAVVPKVANAPGVPQDDSELRCIVSAVYHEARGEPDKGKRAVVETIYHRTAKTGLPICEVVAQKQQFPWFKKKGLVELTPETLGHYNAAMNRPPVLPNQGYIYFNRVKPHGVDCKVIGKHTFCKEET